MGFKQDALDFNDYKNQFEHLNSILPNLNEEVEKNLDNINKIRKHNNKYNKLTS